MENQASAFMEKDWKHGDMETGVTKSNTDFQTHRTKNQTGIISSKRPLAMTTTEGILSYLRDYIAKCKENMTRFLFFSVLLKFKNIKRIQINQKMNITSK